MNISIKELFNDIYFLAQEEGYFSGICESSSITKADEINYFENMLEICSKYIPEYEKYIGNNFFNEKTSLEEKGKMLSELAEENFRQIIYGLVNQ